MAFSTILEIISESCLLTTYIPLLGVRCCYLDNKAKLAEDLTNSDRRPVPGEVHKIISGFRHYKDFRYFKIKPDP